ncbi:MAG: 2-amino-4-hydroxy-6-hydroxymethyldihydropteridine diphosphokinase [Verrucomicrobia bacterium]|nr:2-amino-4-hydroxy-6-hydroxymethyldihydropteridine diphosphokinase [Verrucomicrobiota bacterium]MCF7708631.1 2-amino-4-hydroxy-6-hydroxymethyldihydropteridine diphosphokinase [Verrucomicrobiota bacterium]
MKWDDHAFIALGSNLGESTEIIRRAINALEQLSTSPILRSSLYSSKPVDCPEDSPAFINAAAAIKPLPRLTPESLLDNLLALESEFGQRNRTAPNTPRYLDLDLITYKNQIHHSTKLILPHPRAHLRAFVLMPLNNIAPDLIIQPQTSEDVKTIVSRISQMDKDDCIPILND